MSLVSITDFFGKFNIGQKSNTYVKDKVDEFIAIYEPEYFVKAFGETFTDFYNATPEDAKFDKLNNLLKGNLSPLVGYIFCQYMKDEANLVSGVGTVKTKSENAENVPEWYKTIEAWNIVALRTRLAQQIILTDNDLKEYIVYREIDKFITIPHNTFDL